MDECCLCGLSMAIRSVYRTKYNIQVSAARPRSLRNHNQRLILWLEHVFVLIKVTSAYDLTSHPEEVLLYFNVQILRCVLQSKAYFSKSIIRGVTG